MSILTYLEISAEVVMLLTNFCEEFLAKLTRLIDIPEWQILL